MMPDPNHPGELRPKPDELILAFYKGYGGGAKDHLYDFMIRWWTGPYALKPAKYSHVCGILPRWFPAGELPYEAIEASPRWGGVYPRTLSGNWAQDWQVGNWDFLVIRFPREQDVNKLLVEARMLVGTPYDWKGIWGSQAVRLGINDPNKLYCSELWQKLLNRSVYYNVDWDPKHAVWRYYDVPPKAKPSELIHPQRLFDNLKADGAEFLVG